MNDMKHTVLLHDDEELNDNLRRRSDHDLALATLFSIVHALKGIIEHTYSHHFCHKYEKRESASDYMIIEVHYQCEVRALQLSGASFRNRMM